MNQDDSGVNAKDYIRWQTKFRDFDVVMGSGAKKLTRVLIRRSAREENIPHLVPKVHEIYCTGGGRA